MGDRFFREESRSHKIILSSLGGRGLGVRNWHDRSEGKLDVGSYHEVRWKLKLKEKKIGTEGSMSSKGCQDRSETE